MEEIDKRESPFPFESADDDFDSSQEEVQGGTEEIADMVTNAIEILGATSSDVFDAPPEKEEEKEPSDAAAAESDEQNEQYLNEENIPDIQPSACEELTPISSEICPRDGLIQEGSKIELSESTQLESPKADQIKIVDVQTIDADSSGQTEIMNADHQSEESTPSEEMSTDSSPPVFNPAMSAVSYSYTRVVTSPIEISVPDLGDEDEDLVEEEQAIKTENGIEEEELGEEEELVEEEELDEDTELTVEDLTQDCDDSSDGFKGFESLTVIQVTNDHKYYKILHEGQTFFIKAEKSSSDNSSILESSSPADKISLSECQGCHFKMPNIRAQHDCVPDFCVTCQVFEQGEHSLHLLEHHLSNMRQCPFCQVDLSGLQQLEVHLASHTNLKIRPSICVGCKGRFRTKEGRVRHTCSMQCICKYCNIRYECEMKLSDHLLSQHKNEEEPRDDDDREEGESQDGENVCQFCDKRFTTLPLFKKHVSWHLISPTEDERAGDSDELLVIEENLAKNGVDTDTAKMRCPHCTLNSDSQTINKHLMISKFCKHCLKQFGAAHEYESHMVEYHCSERVCQFCDAEFGNSNLLIEHVKTHTLLEIRPFKCDRCENKFGRQENLSNHKCQGKATSSELVCRDCKIYFQSERALHTHLLAKHACESRCPICKLAADSVAELLSHVENHLPSSSHLQVLCGQCVETFDNDADFYSHNCSSAEKIEAFDYSSGTEPEVLVCSICGLEFPTELKLETHVQETVPAAIEIAKSKFCSVCEVFFATRSSFETHMIKYHLSARQCPFCHKYFASRRYMEQHLLHHTNIHRHPTYCKTCCRFYFSKGLYENHSCESASEEDGDEVESLSSNSPDSTACSSSTKLHYCPVCNIGFKQKRYLEETHMPTHKEKSFECKICQRQFTTIENLKQHILHHEEAVRTKTSPMKDRELFPTLQIPQLQVPKDKNHCVPCRRTFATGQELETHQLTHLYSAKVMNQQDNRISCKFCPCKMESEIWTAQHYTTKHSIIDVLPHQCNICEVRFGTNKERIHHYCPRARRESASDEDPWENVAIKGEPVDEFDTNDEDFHRLLESYKKPTPEPVIKIDHPCAHCGDNFVQASALVDHQIFHQYCPKCPKIFKDRDRYEQHMMYQHACNDRCPFCSQKFRKRTTISQHLLLHTKLPFRPVETIKDKKYCCRNCKFVFNLKASYERHNIEKHTVAHKKCPFCHDKFDSHDDMLSHLKNHTVQNVKKILLHNKAMLKQSAADSKNAKTVQEKKASNDQTAKKSPPVKKLAKEIPTKKPVKLVPAKKTVKGPPAKKQQNEEVERKVLRAPQAKSAKDAPAKKTVAETLDKKGKLASDKGAKESQKSQVAGKGSTSSVADDVDPALLEFNVEAIVVNGNRCLKCRKTIRSSEALYNHVMEMHFGDSPYCPFCGKTARVASRLKTHILRTHKNEMIQADEEAASKNESVSVKSGKSSKKSDPPSKSASSSDAVAPPCYICNKVFVNQNLLDHHVRSSHHMEPAKAQLLQKSVSEAQLSPSKNGESSSGPDKSIFCFHCHTSFNTPAELRSHGVRAKVFCEFCKITLPDTNEFEMHMLEEHPMDDTCQFCGAYIPNKAGLEIHIRRHTNIGPIHYKCFGCNDIFRSARDKDNHLCISYACPKCNKPQRGPDGLDEHMKTAHKKPGRPAKRPSESASAASASSFVLSDTRGPLRKMSKSDEDSSSFTSTIKTDSKGVSSSLHCPHCDRNFNSWKSLCSHAFNSKVYCKECKKVFATKELRAAHKQCDSKPQSSKRTQPSKAPSEEPPAKKAPQPSRAPSAEPPKKKTPQLSRAPSTEPPKKAPQLSRAPSTEPPTKAPQPAPTPTVVKAPYVCRLCGDQFHTYEIFTTHSQTHLIHQCNVCFKVFKNREQLNLHVEADHSKPKKKRTEIKLESDSDDEVMIVEEKQFVML